MVMKDKQNAVSRASYKITEPLCALSLVDRCVQIRVCKHGCDISDLHVFLRYQPGLKKANFRNF